MQSHFCVQFRADFRADFEAKNAYRTKKSMQVNEKLLSMEKPVILKDYGFFLLAGDEGFEPPMVELNR